METTQKYKKVQRSTLSISVCVHQTNWLTHWGSEQVSSSAVVPGSLWGDSMFIILSECPWCCNGLCNTELPLWGREWIAAFGWLTYLTRDANKLMKKSSLSSAKHSWLRTFTQQGDSELSRCYGGSVVPKSFSRTLVKCSIILLIVKCNVHPDHFYDTYKLTQKVSFTRAQRWKWKLKLGSYLN